jgi:hypothetical protein
MKQASNVVIHAADGFSTGHPSARIWNPGNFLAYQMNDSDLPPDHGYPVRIFIPGKFGMKQPKWITRIQFVDKTYLGYWESKGWSDECERQAHARFTDLKEGAKISGKSFELTGYAIGNLDGVKEVEISFDAGKTGRKPTSSAIPLLLPGAFGSIPGSTLSLAPTRFGSAPSMAEARWKIGNHEIFSPTAPPGSKR